MLFFPEFLIPEKSNVDIFIHKKETAQNPFWVGLLPDGKDNRSRRSQLKQK